MYKEQLSEMHLRDQRGNVYVPIKQKKEKSAASSFVSVAVTSLVLGLAVTGLLLHASMKNNERNLAKITALENQVAIVRQSGNQPTTSVEQRMPATSSEQGQPLEHEPDLDTPAGQTQQGFLQKTLSMLR